ncbi:polyphosphate kinase 1 [Cetobacterium somerae]|uniref:polyphosphate kinase 1 n=1 Tax=Cetobacterium somerae TaxID=188913 RepID=UPI00211E276B|nr:polyphosphate kinase 1 [Cetobacterium somerae]MCQ9626754.1 polyphosphate kinase 1 [Cetobacterium somerae]
MKEKKKELYNRDLSWLEFNSRVVHEAKSGRNPFLERAMFLAIASTNLDEFFMVRIPKKREKKEREKIYNSIKKMVDNIYSEYALYLKDLKKEADIDIKDYLSLSKKEKELADDYFNRLIQPILEIIEIDPFHPIPRIASGNLVLLGMIEKKKTKEKKVIMIELRGEFERIIKLEKDKNHFILIEELIKGNLNTQLEDFEIKEIGIFRLTRDEGVEILEDSKVNADIIKEVEDQLEEREWGEVIRVEYDKKLSKEMKDFITKNFSVLTTEIYEISGPINLDFLWTIEGLTGYEKYKYEPLNEKFLKKMKGENIFETLKKKDRLLLHPYESFEAVTELIDTAADDPDVLGIKQTLYRVKHHDSPIIDALEKACKKGKQVTVLVEAKARFDEGDNIEWAKKLERVGCHVIYGIKDLKVHGKTLLILRKENEKIKRYVQLGTGNYYKAPYVDISLFTADEGIGEDISNLFSNLISPQERQNWKEMGVGPQELEDRFKKLVDREISNALKGKKAKIIAKMNGLTDETMIDKLYDASNAGVKIVLIVRGACCLLPGVKNMSENIEVYSIVGRFLEHNRVYIFENNGEKEYFLSSADWMTRNLERRVELMFPVKNSKNRQQLDLYFENILKDNVKRWKENEDGTYSLIKPNKDEKEFSYQNYYLDNKF